MSRLFPHPAYAEDQPLAHTILTTHVLHRGFQTGVLIGGANVLSRALYRRYRPSPSSSSSSSSPKPPNFTSPKALLPRTLHAAGVGGLYGVAALSVALTARMWGREEIEWADRSWRLLENEWQVSVDEWSLVGMGIGLVGFAVAVRSGRLGVGVGGLEGLGAVGLGSLAGAEGSVEWRLGRRWLEREKEKKEKEKMERKRRGGVKMRD